MSETLTDRKDPRERDRGTSRRRVYFSSGSGATLYMEIDMAKPGKQETDQKLDDAVEDSFPASDPPAYTQPTKKVGATDLNEEDDEAADDDEADYDDEDTAEDSDDE